MTTNALSKIYIWQVRGTWFLSRFPKAENGPKQSYPSEEAARDEIKRRGGNKVEVVEER